MLVACNSNSSSNHEAARKRASVDLQPYAFNVKTSAGPSSDTALYLFHSDSIYIRVLLFDPTVKWPERNNTVVSMIKIQGVTRAICYSDSVYCKFIDIMVCDINGDKQNDLMLFFDNGARSNPSYHLYVLRAPAFIKRISGFENLPNIDYDSANNVIVSVALAGVDRIVSFNRVDVDDSLIELHPPITESGDGMLNYDRILRQIKVRAAKH